MLSDADKLRLQVSEQREYLSFQKAARVRLTLFALHGPSQGPAGRPVVSELHVLTNGESGRHAHVVEAPEI
jgi:hypothetical protein